MGRIEQQTVQFNEDLLMVDVPLRVGSAVSDQKNKPFTKVLGGKKLVMTTDLEGSQTWQEVEKTTAIKVNVSQLPDVIQSVQELALLYPSKIQSWLKKKLKKIKKFPTKKDLENKYWGTIAHKMLFNYRVITELLVGTSLNSREGIGGLSPSLNHKKRVDFTKKFEIASQGINSEDVDTLVFTALRRIMVDWVNLNRPYLSRKVNRSAEQLSYLENPHNAEQKLSKAWLQSAKKIGFLHENLESAYSWLTTPSEEKMVFCETGCNLNIYFDEKNKIQIPIIIDIFQVKVSEDGEILIEVGDYKTGQAKDYHNPELPTLLQVLLIKLAAKEMAHSILQTMKEGKPIGDIQWKNYVFPVDKKPLEELLAEANDVYFKYHFPDTLDEWGDIPSKIITISEAQILECAQLLEDLTILLGPNEFRGVIQAYLKAANELSDVINPVVVDEEDQDFTWQRMLF